MKITATNRIVTNLKKRSDTRKSNQQRIASSTILLFAAILILSSTAVCSIHAIDPSSSPPPPRTTSTSMPTTQPPLNNHIKSSLQRNTFDSSSSSSSRSSSSFQPDTRKNDEKDDENNDNESISTTATTTTTTSMGKNSNAALLFSTIQKSLNLTPRKIFRWSCTGIQLGISYYLIKTIWDAFVEVWNELEQEVSFKKGDDGGGKEEHDLPFVSAESVDAFTAAHSSASLSFENLYNSNDKNETAAAAAVSSLSNNKSTMQKEINKSPRHYLNPVAYDLASRLHASGIPYASSLPQPLSGSNEEEKEEGSLTVEAILKSLTKTEGYILSNTLLSPMENTPKAATNLQKQQQQMWDEIGGLSEAKESLLDLVFPLLASSRTATTTLPSSSSHYHSDTHYGGLLSNPPGVLLYGPPGCGKTMLVRALAQSAHVPFLCIKPSTLLRKYVGETNLFVRALFGLAKKIGPCILFVDELDGLFRERGGGGGGGGSGGGVGGGSEEHDVNRDLKTEFMQLWDGIHNERLSSSCQNRKKANVLVIGATNRPFDVDSAFLRRMPRSIYVGLPDYTTRIMVLQSMLQNVPTDEVEFHVEEIAKCTEGYSPSDLKELLRSAALIPLREARSYMMERQKLKMQKERLKMRKEKEEGEDSSSSLSSSSSSFSPFEDMPPLRKLTTADVLQARTKVSPTQLSPGYKAALAAYAKSAGGSGGGLGNAEDRVGQYYPSPTPYHAHQQHHRGLHPPNYPNYNNHHPSAIHGYQQRHHHGHYHPFFADAGTIHHQNVQTYLEPNDVDDDDEEDDDEDYSSDYLIDDDGDDDGDDDDDDDDDSDELDDDEL